MMTDNSALNAFWSLLCTIIALFYLFRLIGGRAWLSHFDPENEVGHGLMAIGMLFMLAPAGLLSSSLILWNSILFAVAALWFTGRLLARKPLLALLSNKNGGRSTAQSDAIHVFMHGGMCYMFLLFSSMAFSMTRPVTVVNYGFVFTFAILTLYYIKEIYKDFQADKRNWMQLGANIAHVLMSSVMGWMFLEMISMTMRMGIH